MLGEESRRRLIDVVLAPVGNLAVPPGERFLCSWACFERLPRNALAISRLMISPGASPRAGDLPM
jgi:hypothetical protein